MSERSKVTLDQLKAASPLALPGLIAECEFYDETESEKVFEDVVKEFEKDGGGIESVLKPVALAIVDGLLERTASGRAMRSKGVTASRVIQDCDSFSYGDMEVGPIPGVSYVDWKNAADGRAAFGQREDRRTYRRSQLEKASAMQGYKDRANDAAAAQGRKNLQDEYTGERNITAYQDNPDKRRNDPKHSHQAETDHVVPLKELHTRLKGNYGLSVSDIRDLANIDSNFALTSSTINRRKGEKTNAEFIAELKKSGDPKDRELAEKMEKMTPAKTAAAEKAIVGAANKAIKDNLLGKGKISRQEFDAAMNDRIKAEEARTGKKLSPEEKKSFKKNEKASLRRKLQRDKALGVYGQASSDAAKQAANYAAGDAILFLLKPIYFELKDSFQNGFAEGVGCTSGTDAVRVRFSRIKKYVMEHATEFLGDGLTNFVKGFISSLIESIIGLFLGMLKNILKLIKEGVRVFVQAAKVIWGKDSAKMSSAEKGDAIVKLIGGSVSAIAGIGIDMLLESAGIPESWTVPLSTMLTGIVSAVFMCILERADLFSVKGERRNARLKEVFEERVADMRADASNFSMAVNRKLIANREQFDALDSAIDKALSLHDIRAVDVALNGMAKFFEVSLPYEDQQSFVRYWKSQSIIRIGVDENAACA